MSEHFSCSDIFVYSESMYLQGSLFFCGLLVLFFGAYFLCEGLFYNRADRIVYMGSNLKEQKLHLSQIIDLYIGRNTLSYNFVEPGAGLSKVSLFLGGVYAWKTVSALELRKSVYIFGRIRTFLSKRPPHFRYIQGDIFKSSFPTPSCMYCYLSTAILDRMYVENRLNDSLVICLSFPITGITPTEIRKLNSWQKVLYVYDFREPI